MLPIACRIAGLSVYKSVWVYMPPHAVEFVMALSREMQEVLHRGTRGV